MHGFGELEQQCDFVYSPWLHTKFELLQSIYNIFKIYFWEIGAYTIVIPPPTK